MPLRRCCRAIDPLFSRRPLAQPEPSTSASTPGRHRNRRRRRVIRSAVLLPLLALLQGCGGNLLGLHQTLHVVVVPTNRTDWALKDSLQEGRILNPLLSAFRRLQPGVEVQISLQNEEGLEEMLRRSSSRGMAPDLLLLISPLAVALIDHGLIDPLPSRDPEIASLLRLISPVDLTRVRDRKSTRLNSSHSSVSRMPSSA